MHRLFSTFLATFLVAAAAATASTSHAAATLKPYRDDAELAGALERWRRGRCQCCR